MIKLLFRTAAVVVISLPIWAGCATTPPPADTGAVSGKTEPSPSGHNPTSGRVVSDLPPAIPATGVETISVASYVYEPAAEYLQGESARALAESGVQLVVMGKTEPRTSSDRAVHAGPQGAAKVGSSPKDAAATETLTRAAPELPLAPPALASSFDSIDFTTNITETPNSAFIPPDPDAAAGPNHVVNVVNSVIRFHQKNGTVDFTDSLKDFFLAEVPDTFTFDPKVVFDPFAGRFLVVTLEKQVGPPDISEIFLAVSDDADPNGVWCTTTISGNTMIGGIDRWADYPGFAVDEDAVYISANMFAFAGGFSAGVRLWVVDKGLGSNGFYDCGTAIVSKLDPIVGGAFNVTLQPAQIHGTAPAGVGTFLAGYSGLTGGGSEFVQIIRLDDPLGTPVFTTNFVNAGNIEDFASFLDAPQSGPPATLPIATNGRRALDAEWFNNRLWVTASISPKAGDTDAGEVTAHWWEISTSVLGTPALADQGNIFGDDHTADLWTFFPSVAVNGLGQAGFGYSGSASSIFAGSFYTARNPGDAAGTTQGTAQLKAGEATYFRQFCSGSNRWGDYSGADTDPVDGCFWFYNEHAWTTGNASNCNAGEIGRWETHNGKMCPTGSCPADMWLEDIDLSGAQTRKAGSRISTGDAVTVKTGANVTLQALDKVVFFNGFQVEAGADLTVELKAGPCL